VIFRYLFHYVVQDRIIYLCMCDEIMGRVTPFEFLNDIRQRFVCKSLLFDLL
jgi:vesicle-associated membrane protein 7